MRLLASAIGTLLALAGEVFGVAAGAAGQPEWQTDLETAVQARGLDPETIVFPARLNDEMRNWLQERVEPVPSSTRLLHELLEILLDADGFGLKYTPRYTGTAEEVFYSHEANCLAFTHLFVAMSRELGINTYFVNYSLIERFRRTGDLIVISGHVSAGFSSGTERHLLQFGAVSGLDARTARRISDLNALARYYANRGAELLRDGDLESALRWSETATQLDPALADGWTNLGVARRRAGDLEGASQAYLRATEVDPDHFAAYHNLSVVLRLQGRQDAQLGDQSLEAGRLEEARRFYRRASILGDELAETKAARGHWALLNGQPKRARKWLRRAQAVDPEEERTVELERLLLKELGSPHIGKKVGLESGTHRDSLREGELQ
jgi:Flp pilus assembly protein TadD